MTQRIFDRDNAEDMTQLWSILPDNIESIEKKDNNDGILLKYENGYIDEVDIFKINWHDKTEITRPMQEATEADIGKLCKFWNNNVEEYRIAIFTGILDKFNYLYNFCDNTDTYWMHCRKLTKQEIEELC